MEETCSCEISDGFQLTNAVISQKIESLIAIRIDVNMFLRKCYGFRES